MGDSADEDEGNTCPTCGGDGECHTCWGSGVALDGSPCSEKCGTCAGRGTKL